MFVVVVVVSEGQFVIVDWIVCLLVCVCLVCVCLVCVRLLSQWPFVYLVYLFTFSSRHCLHPFAACQPRRTLRSSKEKLLKIRKRNWESFGNFFPLQLMASFVWNPRPENLGNLPPLFLSVPVPFENLVRLSFTIECSPVPLKCCARR